MRYGLLRYLCSFAVKFIYFIGRVVGLLREAVAAEGVGSLFKGCGANILRGVAGAGVISMYDQLQMILFGKKFK